MPLAGESPAGRGAREGDGERARGGGREGSREQAFGLLNCPGMVARERSEKLMGLQDLGNWGSAAQEKKGGRQRVQSTHSNPQPITPALPQA